MKIKEAYELFFPQKPGISIITLDNGASLFFSQKYKAWTILSDNAKALFDSYEELGVKVSRKRLENKKVLVAAIDSHGLWRIQSCD